MQLNFAYLQHHFSPFFNAIAIMILISTSPSICASAPLDNTQLTRLNVAELLSLDWGKYAK